MENEITIFWGQHCTSFNYSLDLLLLKTEAQSDSGCIVESALNDTTKNV